MLSGRRAVEVPAGSFFRNLAAVAETPSGTTEYVTGRRSAGAPAETEHRTGRCLDQRDVGVSRTKGMCSRAICS